MSQPSSGFNSASSGRPRCGSKWICCGAGGVLAGLKRLSLLCGLRDGWELLAGTKLRQLPGPDGCEHHVLLDAGLAAASVLCQVVFQADSCSQAFPPFRLPLTFFGAVLLLPRSRAVCSPPQQTPAASHGSCGPWTGKKQQLFLL